jgi:benzoyl-CoA reductase/2-hydroxyglutaryl-CoA dehydratase subunit BcrC/BadD/HgdB
MEKSEERQVESQMMVRECMAEAIGLYIAKEPKHTDEWRDKSVWANFEHLRHELEEINRSATTERQLHNALDACAQAAILAARLKLEMGTGKDKGYLLHTPR